MSIFNRHALLISAVALAAMKPHKKHQGTFESKSRKCRLQFELDIHRGPTGMGTLTRKQRAQAKRNAKLAAKSRARNR